MPRANTGPYLRINRAGIFEIAWPDGEGTTRSRSARTRDRAVAERALASFITQQHAQGDQPGQLTVGEILDLYAAKHLPSTIEGETTRRSIIPPLKAHFGAKMPAEITDDLVKAYDPPRQRGKTHGPHLSDSTKRKHLAYLIAALGKGAKSFKVVERRDIPEVPLPDRGNPRDRILERHEHEAMMTAAAGQRGPDGRLSRLERYCAINYEAPYRKQRIVELRWSLHIDLDRRTIDPRNKGERRTRKRVVAVPISDALLPVLRRAYEERTSDWVLDNPKTIDNEFRRARTAAGISPDFTPHTYRHTWITDAVIAGREWWEISAMTGDSEQTLRENYLHLRPDHLRAAANFRGAPKPTLAVKRAK